MGMEKFIRKIEKEVMQQREEEQGLIDSIAALTAPGFAEEAADVLDPRKHLYGMEGYLSLLQMLVEALSAGMPPGIALDAVQAGWGMEGILRARKDVGADNGTLPWDRQGTEGGSRWRR